MQEIRATLGTDLGGHARTAEAAEFEDAVWSCTNCYACEQACPARIRHVDAVLDFRRALVDQNRLDEQKLGVLAALDRNQNPYRLPSHERAAWLAEVPYADEVVFGVAEPAEPPEYLYWIGCSGAYDERAAEVARATMDLLHQAGISFVTLGPAEPCCGEPAKRLGEEGRFQMLAVTAMEMIRETGARRIVTQCPHGLNTFLHEYPALGLELPAEHHSELLLRLVREGRLRPQDAGRSVEVHGAAAGGDVDEISRPVQAGPLVYHEPCNLARAGRPPAALDLLCTAPGAGEIRLPPRSGRRTFCCGGGGANSFYQVEQEERRISGVRLDELLETGAGRIVVSCPFCLTMLRDAAGSRPEEGAAVLDVAEVLRGAVAAPADDCR
jgi:Fe-S oxidoreductase